MNLSCLETPSGRRRGNLKRFSSHRILMTRLYDSRYTSPKRWKCETTVKFPTISGNYYITFPSFSKIDLKSLISILLKGWFKQYANDYYSSNKGIVKLFEVNKFNWDSFNFAWVKLNKSKVDWNLKKGLQAVNRVVWFKGRGMVNSMTSWWQLKGWFFKSEREFR